jgi:hypothetical protein
MNTCDQMSGATDAPTSGEEVTVIQAVRLSDLEPVAEILLTAMKCAHAAVEMSDESSPERTAASMAERFIGLALEHILSFHTTNNRVSISGEINTDAGVLPPR